MGIGILPISEEMSVSNFLAQSMNDDILPSMIVIFYLLPGLTCTYVLLKDPLIYSIILSVYCILGTMLSAFSSWAHDS